MLCQCRDFARLDFILDKNQNSLFSRNQYDPRNDRNTVYCQFVQNPLGLDFDALVYKMIQPTIERFSKLLLAMASRNFNQNSWQRLKSDILNKSPRRHLLAKKSFWILIFVGIN